MKTPSLHIVGLRDICLLVLLAMAPAAVSTDGWSATGKRVALVIGNGDYKIAPKLDNPVADARAIAAMFKRLGFQVTEGYDQSIAQMRSTLLQFTNVLVGSDAAVVYFAGHGVSVDDENYLLPTDIELKTPTDLDINTMDVALILRQLQREDRVNILILDACRINPFAMELGRAKTRAVVAERGLAPIEGILARGSLIAFATDPKSAAFDGPRGEHSPFTEALLHHLEDADTSIETVMARVRSEVWQTTKNQQLPWVNTALIGEFDLNPKHEMIRETPSPTQPTTVPQPAAPAASAERQATENIFWESSQRSNLLSDYQAYLDAFPTGIFAQMARNRIAALTPPTPLNPVSPPAPTAPLTGEVMSKEQADAEEAEKNLNLGVTEHKEIQRRLIALKFDPGPPDGELGVKARRAIREWQISRKLPASGFLGPLQYAELKSESVAILQDVVPIRPVERNRQYIRLPIRPTPPPERREPVRIRLEQRDGGPQTKLKDSKRQAMPVKSNSDLSTKAKETEYYQGRCPSGFEERNVLPVPIANMPVRCVPR